MNDIVIPDSMPDFDSEPFQGSIQQLLAANIGKSVRVEYGNPSFVQQGVIYAVGLKYLLLWDENARTYRSGNLDELRSINIHIERHS